MYREWGVSVNDLLREDKDVIVWGGTFREPLK